MSLLMPKGRSSERKEETALVWPKNQWYVAALSAEVGPDPIERMVLGEPIVLYRKSDGQVVVLDNRCAHRCYPLSKGKVIGDQIQCHYHGFRYDSSGACVLIPSLSAHKKIPEIARVRSYPVAEPAAWVWIWMGDPAAADATLIPDHHWMKDPAYAPIFGTHLLEAPYYLLNDNLLDLSHVAFLHPSSFGNPEVAAAGIETDLVDGVVTLRRHVPSEPSPPLFEQAAGLTGEIERLYEQWFVPPAYNTVQITATPRGKPRGKGAVHRVCHFGTPVTADKTIMYWAQCRDYALHDAEVNELVRRMVTQAIGEDADALQEQYRLQRLHPQSSGISIAADAAAVQGRRALERMIEAELSSSAGPKTVAVNA